MRRKVNRNYKSKRITRRRRIRAKVSGTREKPRLSVFRSNRQLQAQIIDDTLGFTLVSLSTLGIKGRETKVSKARKLGFDLAKKSLEKGIERVVFDRGGYLYHGRIKALADGAREGGLKF